MSRTLKDRPLIYSKLDSRKKKRHFISKAYCGLWREPGLHKRLTTTIKRRNYFANFKAKITRSLDLELLDPINIWNKPHVYYW